MSRDHMPDAFIHAMPAHIPALKSAGMKWGRSGRR